MATKHTPGPWRTTGSLICNESCELVASVSCASGDDAVEAANARLIAAAPELLEKLQDVLRRIEESDEWWMDCPDRGGFDADAISATIAKATGQ